MTAVGAFLGAGGIPLLLLGGARRVRLLGLGLALVAWLVLALALAPGTPWVGAAALIALGAGAVVCGRFLAWRRRLWLGLVGATLVLRVPVSTGGEEARLLIPLYLVILAGVGAACFRSAATDRPRAPRSLAAALAAFAGFATLSLAWSADPRAGAIWAGAFIIPFVLLFWLLVELWPEAGGVRALAVGGLGVAVLASLTGIAQAVLGVTFANEKLAEIHAAGGVFRANSFLFDPNTLGRVLAVGLVCLVGAAYLAARRGGGLAPVVALGAVLALGLALTVSQSSGLALGAGLVVLLARVYGWRRVAAVATVSAVGLVGWAAVGVDPVRDIVTSQERIARASDGRDHLIAGGVAVWREAPVVGVGTGGFARRYAETLTPDERRHATVFVSHTAPVTVLAELGVVGVALLAWLAAAAFLVLSNRRAPHAWTRAVIGAMLVALFVHSLLTGSLMEDPIVWALVGTGCAVAARGPASGPSELPNPGRPVKNPHPVPESIPPLLNGRHRGL